MISIFGSDGFAEKDTEVVVFIIDENREYMGSIKTVISAGTGLPAGAYLDEPPLKQTGKAILRSSDGNKWDQVDDYRGQIIYATDGSGPAEVKLPGELPPDYTLLEPVTAYDEWNGRKWVTNKENQKLGQIAKAEADKTALIDAANLFIASNNWPSKLALGRLNDDDKARFNLWLDYIDEVIAVDTQKATEVEWPTPPK